MSFDLDELNEEQIKPVLDTEGAVMVTAGAGSGKTRLLTHRIAHLIDDLNVPPYHILAITFTNKAANEMKERLMKMVNIDGMWIFTFHAMCVRILRRFIKKIGYTSNFTIYGEAEKEHAVKRLLKDVATETDDADLYKRVMHAISDAKNSGLSPEDYLAINKFEPDIETVCDIYAKYQEELAKCNSLDYDDLLNKAFFLLKTDAEAREFYQDKFRYIHVDEFQDTNAIQYQIVKILGLKHRNIFVVGDEDQCIYGWRGANIQNIYDFTKDFHCKQYKLERNYRSSKKILELANKIIVNNTSRMEKNLWTENEEGVRVETYTGNNEGQEAEYVVEQIMNLVRNNGYKYSDFAILMRLNALTRPFEERLIQYNIPHRIYGGFKFFERKEIKDLLAYLNIVVNHYDNEAILRVINFPKRGLGDTAIAKLAAYAADNGMSLYDVIMEIENTDLPSALVARVLTFATIIRLLTEEKDNLELSELVKYLVRMLNLKEVYGADTEENANRKMNISDFIGSVKQYTDANDGVSLEDYLQNITLYSDLDTMDETNCVNIATVHSAKGLEFKVVFIIGLEDGIFPISRALDSNRELEEERRLMYVGITRAIERLYLTRSMSRFMYGNRKETLPSRFLKELGYDTEQRSNYIRVVGGDDGGTPGKIYQPQLIRPATAVKTDKDLSAFTVGARVRHRKFGEGVIMAVTDNVGNPYAEIAFEKMGKMTLALNYAPLEAIEQE